MLVCPFTSHQETLPYRVPVSLPYGDAVRASWAMTDKLMAVKRERIRASVGRVSSQEFAAIESAIADLLGLVLAQQAS
ncbi:type II toxin-antitoxin system PemK/MazF family toxin [uncultured Thiocystis sp.]|uniref:type II toxin-antitoxin system PemK/MazF family toxin n=1 Tax=uncultured Thiocystis sp. TaxID=1202134 RepID=UPI00342AD0A1